MSETEIIDIDSLRAAVQELSTSKLEALYICLYGELLERDMLHKVHAPDSDTKH